MSHFWSCRHIGVQEPQHVATTDDDRDAVLRVLRNSDVKGIAERAGIDLRRASGAVSTLQGEDLARVAAQARQVENALAGGATPGQWAFYILGLAIIPLILLVVVLL